MRKRLLALASQDNDFQIVAALDNFSHPAHGQDAGLLAGVEALDVPLSAAWPEAVDVAIDFSIPAACSAAVRHCHEQRIPLVVATTGLSPAQIAEIEEASQANPICWAPSMSLAVNLTM